MICTCGIWTCLRITLKSIFTETLRSKILLCKNCSMQTGKPLWKLQLLSVASGLWHQAQHTNKFFFKLESVERTNAGLPSSGSAFHGAAGAQVSSQSERTWPYIREHHILGNASRANSLGQSYPEQGVKQPEVYFATTKTSIISLPEPAVITNPSPFHQHLVGCCDQGRRGA